MIVVSLIYYVKFSNKGEFKYNGFRILHTGPAVYDIEIFLKNDPNPHYISVRYDPRRLKDIEIEENLKERIFRDQIYITLSEDLTANSVVAVSEMSKIMGNRFLFNTPVHTALAYSKKGIPLKKCSDVTTKDSVILLRLGEENRVYKQNECIIIEGKTEEDIIKASTKLSLSLLGIVK